MPFQPAPDVAEVRMGFSYKGQKYQNIFHVKTSESWSAEFLENLSLFFLQYWEDNMLTYMSDQVHIDYCKVRDLTTEFAGYAEAAPATDVTGSRTSPAMPGNVTVANTWTTGLTGRSTRGRTYHVGLTEDMCLDNELASTFQGLLFSVYNDLIQAITTEDGAWTLGVLSRVQNGATLPEALFYEIVNSAVDPFLDSQRRRLAGRGQ